MNSPGDFLTSTAGSEPATGRYRVGRQLGRGRFGRVFGGHDPLLDRPVALKILDPGLDEAQRRLAIERFRVELRVLGRVAHPHVVQVFDASLSGTQPFLVMELCSGPTLATWRTRHQHVPPGQAAVIFHQAALALDHIHRLGIVHRDIKPANLLFHHKQLKLIDFGVARADFTPVEDTVPIVGTAGYMPPEQVAGDPVSSRSDLFSLAAVLYELLTARVPFPGDPASITYIQVFDHVPRLSPDFPDLPPDFDDFFAKALARDPSDRFASAPEMVAALSGIVPEDALEPISGAAGPGQALAPPPPSGFRYGKVWSPVSGRFPYRPPREPAPFPANAPAVTGAVPAPWAEDEATSPFGADVVAFEGGSPKTDLLRAAFAAAVPAAKVETDGHPTVRIDRQAGDPGHHPGNRFPAAEQAFSRHSRHEGPPAPMTRPAEPGAAGPTVSPTPPGDAPDPRHPAEDAQPERMDETDGPASPSPDSSPTGTNVSGRLEPTPRAVRIATFSLIPMLLVTAVAITWSLVQRHPAEDRPLGTQTALDTPPPQTAQHRTERREEPGPKKAPGTHARNAPDATPTDSPSGIGVVSSRSAPPAPPVSPDEEVLKLDLRIRRGLDGLRFEGTAHGRHETWRIVEYARTGTGRYTMVLEPAGVNGHTKSTIGHDSKPPAEAETGDTPQTRAYNLFRTDGPGPDRSPPTPAREASHHDANRRT